MVAAAHVGPKPLPYKSLTAGSLAEAIRFCLSKEVRQSAQNIAKKLNTASGVKNAVRSFHAQLPLKQLRCDILGDQPAVWTYRRKNMEVKLSGVAAEVLARKQKIDQKKLKL